MKTLRNTLAIMSLLSLSLSAKALPESIGIIDFQKVEQTISFDTIVQERTEGRLGDQGKAIRDATATLNAKQNDLQDKAKTMSEAQIKALAQEIATLRTNLQSLQMQVGKKLNADRQSLWSELKDQIYQTTSSIAKKHKLDLVLTANSAAYVANKVDLTDEMIAELKKIYGTQAPNSSTPSLMSPRAKSIRQ